MESATVKYEPITVDLIKRNGAPTDDAKLFHDVIGDGALPLDPASVSKRANFFDWEWLSENLLDDDDYEAFSQLRTQYLHKFSHYLVDIARESTFSPQKARLINTRAWNEYMKNCALAFVDIYRKGMEG